MKQVLALSRRCKVWTSWRPGRICMGLAPETDSSSYIPETCIWSTSELATLDVHELTYEFECQWSFVFGLLHVLLWPESKKDSRSHSRVYSRITYQPSRQGGCDCESALPLDELVCPFGQTSWFCSDGRWRAFYYLQQGWFSAGIYCCFHFWVERQRQILKGHRGPFCVYLGW